VSSPRHTYPSRGAGDQTTDLLNQTTLPEPLLDLLIHYTTGCVLFVILPQISSWKHEKMGTKSMVLVDS